MRSDLGVLEYKAGYIIGVKCENRIVCKASKRFTNREDAEKALKEGRVYPKCLNGCEECSYGLSTYSWGITQDDTLDDNINRYYFYLDSPGYTDLGKILKESEVVLDVFYDKHNKNIDKVIIHDGNMNKIDYDLTEEEFKKVYVWINALEHIKEKKMRSFKGKLNNMNTKINILSLAYRQGQSEIFDKYLNEIEEELRYIFKPYVVDKILQEILESL